MKEILLFVAGIILGGGITAFIFLKLFPAVGCLREDRSDPTAPPYLFLELRPDGYEKIHKKQQIRLKIRLENYISAENTSAIMR